MKRYFAFAGSRYYPSGGMGDLTGDFDTKEEAVSSALTVAGELGYDMETMWRFRWAHVWDSQEGRKVWENGK